MKLFRLGAIGHEIPAVQHQGRTLDLRSLTADIDGAFFASGGLQRVAQALAAGTLPELADAASLRIGAPVARPAAVVCIGLNYAAHAAESNLSPPAHPIVFFKHPNTVVGPNDTVPLPVGSAALDWEVELALVIGRRIDRLITEDQAPAYIAGFTVANDVSERDYQLKLGGTQWSKGKSMPASLPLGPSLVTPDEVDCQALAIRSWVNDAPRQASSTRDMIFSVNRILHDLSRYMALEAGDVVITGTPEGVALSGRFPYLQVGDCMRMEIEHLGSQLQLVGAAR